MAYNRFYGENRDVYLLFMYAAHFVLSCRPCVGVYRSRHRQCCFFSPGIYYRRRCGGIRLFISSHKTAVRFDCKQIQVPQRQPGGINEAPRPKGRGFCLSAVLRSPVRIFSISYSSPRPRLKRRGRGEQSGQIIILKYFRKNNCKALSFIVVLKNMFRL